MDANEYLAQLALWCERLHNILSSLNPQIEASGSDSVSTQGLRVALQTATSKIGELTESTKTLTKQSETNTALQAEVTQLRDLRTQTQSELAQLRTQHETELTQLRAETDSEKVQLQAQIDSRDSDLSQERDRIKTMRKQNDKLRHDVSSFGTEIGALRAQHLSQLSDLRKTHSAELAKNRVQATDFAAADLKASTAQKEVDTLRAQHQKDNTKHTELQNTNVELRVSNAELRASSTELQTRNTRLNTSNTRLQASNDQLLASNNQLRTANSQLQAGNTQLQASSSKLLASNTRLQTANTELQDTNTELSVSNVDLQANNAESQTNNAKLRIELREAKRQNKIIATQFLGLRSHDRGKTRVLRRRLFASERRVKLYKSQLFALSIQQAHHKTDMVKRLHEQLAQSRREIEVAHEDALTKLGAEIETEKRSLAILQTDCTDQVDRVTAECESRIANEKSRLRQILAKQSTRHAEQIKSMRQECNDLLALKDSECTSHNQEQKQTSITIRSTPSAMIDAAAVQTHNFPISRPSLPNLRSVSQRNANLFTGSGSVRLSSNTFNPSFTNLRASRPFSLEYEGSLNLNKGISDEPPVLLSDRVISAQSRIVDRGSSPFPALNSTDAMDLAFPASLMQRQNLKRVRDDDLTSPEDAKRLRRPSLFEVEDTAQRTSATPLSEKSRVANTSARVQGAPPEYIAASTSEIWSLFHPSWIMMEDEKDQLLSQIRGLFTNGKSVNAVIETIDKHVVGNFRKNPPDPPPCLMATLYQRSAGPGGPTMSQGSCPYCKTDKARICVYASYVPGVASGFGPRVQGIINETTWNPNPQPRTVVLGGQEVRWILHKRKAPSKRAP